MTARQDGARRVIAAADARAHGLGLRPGQTVAHARTLAPDLVVAPAEPEADAADLDRLAAWCLRYAPLVAPDPPRGIWIDVAGSAHLFGGEPALLDDLVARLRRAGIAARAAVADTPGAAWAAARFGSDVIVPSGQERAALDDLPVAALRLAPDTVAALRQVGIERIGQLAALPGAPVTRRFGAEVRRRLDQALGHTPEPLRPLVPAEPVRRRMAFAEPIGDRDGLARVVERLCAGVCDDLARADLGVRLADLVCTRVDAAAQAVRIGTARPTRERAHLARLLTDRLERIDPGFGIDEVALIAARVEPLPAAQLGVRGLRDEAAADLAPLVDRLSLRLGERSLYRLAPRDSDVPERSVARVAPLAPPGAATWSGAGAHPVRLLDPPEPVTALALLPDRPPAAFVWRNARRRVVRADGPERILGEWWRCETEWAARDYYRVEDHAGARYWLFRDAPAEDGGRWFLHGLFA